MGQDSKQTVRMFERLLEKLIQEAIDANLELDEIQDVLSRATRAIDRMATPRA